MTRPGIAWQRVTRPWIPLPRLSRCGICLRTVPGSRGTRCRDRLARVAGPGRILTRGVAAGLTVLARRPERVLLTGLPRSDLKLARLTGKRRLDRNMLPLLTQMAANGQLLAGLADVTLHRQALPLRLGGIDLRWVAQVEVGAAWPASTRRAARTGRLGRAARDRGPWHADSANRARGQRPARRALRGGHADRP